MSILFKSFFMNNWGGVAKRKTWLQADKSQVDWENKVLDSSTFMNKNVDSSTFMDKSKIQESWMQNEDGTPDFKEEGEEKYID